MNYTLVCSAAGSGLSTTIQKLGQYSSDHSPLPATPAPAEDSQERTILAKDVESHLCTRSDVWNTPLFKGAQSAKSMAQLCSKLPRSDVAGHWRRSLAVCLEELEQSECQHKVLACHLTLFSTARNEHYIPGRTRDFLGQSDEGAPKYRVQRVIVLIDDLYDMFARLTGPYEAISEDQQLDNYATYTKKLTGADLRDGESGYPDLLQLENRFRLLQVCLQWRKAELIHAESLARSLGDVPFTVLAVKHRLKDLHDLVVNPDVSGVYLSHKITEARRQNKEKPGYWPPFVDEVNRLSEKFGSVGITLIHPTGIDELRTTSSTGIGDAKIGLGDRWPLQSATSDLMYVPPDKGRLSGPEYKDLFSGFSFDDEGSLEQAVAHFRAFELTVFNEIAFRDHLLVSCADGLLLYRPLAENGEDSSGARAEVQHWSQLWESDQSGSPRLVALHRFEDILQRLSKLDADERSNLKHDWILALVSQGYDQSQAVSLVNQEKAETLHLYARTGAERDEDELENAALVALMQCFNAWLCNVHLPASRLGAAIIAKETADDLVSADVLETVSKIFKGDDDTTVVTFRSLAEYSNYAGHKTLSSLAWHLIAD